MGRTQHGPGALPPCNPQPAHRRVGSPISTRIHSISGSITQQCLPYEAVKGVLDESVLMRQPLTAQSSAFHRLEYILIGWSFGNGTPIDPAFLNSPIGVPSTENLLTCRQATELVLSQKTRIWGIQGL
ncbi:hypothetical protein CRG98_019728 [Punica granatum]|uniref:Uncharacterized protein n=1 Tax=Punica granatum TaxID=22663 RepID=A0A2I0JWK7_PUNGR|nr:hypothetical protein CRG98_019728 [Punica granatum]